MTCYRPAGQGCPEPKGLDRRCRSRSADSCSPTPTDRTLRRSFRSELAAPPQHMWKDRIEDERGLVCEVLNILRKFTAEDSEEAYRFLVEGHPMREVQRSDRIRRLLAPLLNIPGVELQSNALHARLDGHVRQQGGLRSVSRESSRTRTLLDLLHRSVAVREVHIQRHADMLFQPLDDLLTVTIHRRRRRVNHVLEDRVEHRARHSRRAAQHARRPFRQHLKGTAASRLP